MSGAGFSISGKQLGGARNQLDWRIKLALFKDRIARHGISGKACEQMGLAVKCLSSARRFLKVWMRIF